MKNETTGAAYVCAVAIFFADGTAETQVLHRGSSEDCEAVSEMFPACSFSGAKPVMQARMIVKSAMEWDAMIEGLEHHHEQR